MRFLAIDFGEQRTGLAIGDDSTRIVSPAGVVESGKLDEQLRVIGDVIDEHGANALVVGLPLNMDGTEGPRAHVTRDFAARLGERFGLAVHLVDERLSSEIADDKMSRSGLTHKGKKQRRDALAAATILERFLDTLEF